MWGKKNKQTKSSDFFKGENLLSTLAKSFFGKIRDTFTALFSGETEDNYKLPTVYVVGNESTGKSSLLENITKCQIFPRDSKLCTKCPIHVKMSNGPSRYVISYYEPTSELKKQKIVKKVLTDKSEIYNVVSDYMNKFPQDTISENELIIEIADENLPNFEFYDLPGIRTYPQETAITTINLCKKYLSVGNSIILCVVPATTTRLTSCQSIALITEMGLQQNCILALTMADRLQGENIEELLIKRIIGTSDELRGLNFAGYVSVANRVHSDINSLEENDDIEKNWFSKEILEIIPDEYKQYENKIKENITISNLLRQMDTLYSKFINNNWKPQILSQIDEKINNLDKEYDNLGDVVDEEVCVEINKIFNHYIKNIYTTKKDKHSYKNLPKFDGLVENHCEKYYAMLNHINRINDYYVSKDHNLIVEHMKNGISKIEDFNMCRFQKAIDLIGERIRMSLCDLSTIHLDHIKELTINKLNMDYIGKDEDAALDYGSIFASYYNLFVLYPTFYSPIKLSIEDLEESDEYKEHRRRILAEITKSQEHKGKIESLQI
jgi:hypothetical protein